MTARVLHLLRHATAEAHAAALRDSDRPLTPEGHAEARGVGEYLAGADVEHILCSPAVRTRETVADLGLAAPVDFDPSLYHSGSEYVRRAISLVDDEITHLLVVGHAPGIPALTHELYDPDASHPEAMAEIAAYFPTATLVRLEFDGSWLDIATAGPCARLTMARRSG